MCPSESESTAGWLLSAAEISPGAGTFRTMISIAITVAAL
jgi:hypothetical protein